MKTTPATFQAPFASKKTALVWLQKFEACQGQLACFKCWWNNQELRRTCGHKLLHGDKDFLPILLAPVADGVSTWHLKLFNQALPPHSHASKKAVPIWIYGDLALYVRSQNCDASKLGCLQPFRIEAACNFQHRAQDIMHLALVGASRCNQRGW